MSEADIKAGLKLEQAGRFSQALELYERLLTHNPDHPALLWGQGRCLMHYTLREPAARVLQRAVRVFPRHEKMVEDVIGRLIVLGKPADAVQLSDNAIHRFPSNLTILLHRGDALRVLGRDEEAIAVFRQLLELQPGHLGAVHSLVNSLRNSAAVDAALATARNSLETLDGSGLERAGLVNEVAHCENALANYDRAFAGFVESGRIVLQTPQARAISNDTYPRRIDSYQRWIEANGLPALERAPGSDERNLIFLLGFPRSGTTLLESILTAAPGVVSSGEAPVLDAALNELMAGGVSIDDCLETMGPGNEEALARAREAYWRLVEGSYGSAFNTFIDKQPLNTLYIPHIRLLFPEAKIIFCERDPRDVCLSCFFQWFALNAANKLFCNWRTTAAFYSRMMDYWFALEPLVGEAVYKVRHETLVADFPNQIRALIERLEIPWDDAVLEFADKNRDRYFATPSNRAVREGVSADNTQRWKHYAKAIAEVDELLRPSIEKLGYPHPSEAAMG